MFLSMPKISRGILSFTALLAMYYSMQLYFTWLIPQTALILLYFFASFLFVATNKQCVTRNRFVASLLIVSVFLYEGLFVYPNTFGGWIYLLARSILVITLICSSSDYMASLLKLIIRVTAIIILVSLVFWGLFLAGVPLSHYRTETNDFYEHTVYYFFILNGTESQLIPRFASIFLEPGHLGSTSCLLLFLNGITLRKWENAVFIIATLLSLSLAAYGLLIGGIGLYMFANVRYAFLKVLPFIIVLALLVVFFMNYKGGNNPVNEKILMRLVFEDGKMTGSNRTSMAFDAQYDIYVESSETILGKGRDVMASTSTTTILNGCASWKRYFFLRGYVGSALLLLFLFYYLFSYPTKSGFCFLVLYLVCNAIRDYPLDELWLYLVILALPLYQRNKLFYIKAA